jgi:hypothetical protein
MEEAELSAAGSEIMELLENAERMMVVDSLK